MTPLTVAIIEIIKGIPKGKVMTYGQIAALAGHPKGARQVVRVLHSMSQKQQLPWHRVINKEGKISITSREGYLLQKELLVSEGVQFSHDERVDLGIYQCL